MLSKRSLGRHSLCTDRKAAPRVPITARLVADLITTAGAHRVLGMFLRDFVSFLPFFSIL